jgi:hypothetical protein
MLDVGITPLAVLVCELPKQSHTQGRVLGCTTDPLPLPFIIEIQISQRGEQRLEERLNIGRVDPREPLIITRASGTGLRVQHVGIPSERDGWLCAALLGDSLIASVEDPTM